MPKIVHLTSVHVPADNRIFRKECAAAVAAGYEVVLIAPHTHDDVRSGVRICAVPRPRNRYNRLTATIPAVAKAAVKERGDLYQFHDPELIPVGLMLRALGRNVVYDIHEDYVKAVAQKPHIHRLLRSILARLVGLAEALSCPHFDVVLAEKCYRQRFPRGTFILNYPVLADFRRFSAQICNAPAPRVLYTGGIAVERGALNHVQLLHQIPDIEVFLVGRCSVEMAHMLREHAGAHTDRLHIVGEGRFVPFEEIIEYYSRGGWLAALALFPRTPHYEEKELTKFFEYMAAGIPIVCSNFPVWQRLIEAQGVGVCVEPQQVGSFAKKIWYLRNHREEARAMALRGLALARQFSWEAESVKLMRLYTNVLRRRRSKTAAGLPKVDERQVGISDQPTVGDSFNRSTPR
ncbi:MAG: glycosyltransferase [Longimicrobiales bacterium]